jgi:UDP-GlcNAc3NAcA epimerase
MPEEINRVLTDHVAAILFAPTEVAVRNLQNEGLTGDAVVRSGDVMYDAALFYGARADKKSRILEQLQIVPGQYVLATVHRAENTDDPQRLHSIVSALVAVSESAPVVLPLHPRTRATLNENPQFSASLGKLRIIDPVGYFDMITLEKHACVIATDSGGVQKEASFHNVRCVTLRSETEWEELISAQRNVLAPPERGPAFIEQSIRESMLLPRLESAEIYGDGHAAERIVESILEHTAVRQLRSGDQDHG